MIICGDGTKLVEVWILRKRDCTWVRAWVTLQEAWRTLPPPPGAHKEW